MLLIVWFFGTCKFNMFKLFFRFSDKTSNICKLDTDEYRKLANKAVTSTYKKVS